MKTKFWVVVPTLMPVSDSKKSLFLEPLGTKNGDKRNEKSMPVTGRKSIFQKCWMLRRDPKGHRKSTNKKPRCRHPTFSSNSWLCKHVELVDFA
jgi:hypothetical protein